ncbi:MAG: ATP--guanido phosphotransferase [Clostridiales bacterium]|nr:ATP--guanido phosphotransferase [Clostridiales bacterium]
MAFTLDATRGNIIMSRIRLARNLNGYPFVIKSVPLAKDIIKKVNRAVVKCDTFNLFYMSNFSDLKLEAMKERHLISQNLIDNKLCGAALINADESISIMINEEDVIREQCFMRGLRVSEAYKKLSQIDDELVKNLDIAYTEKWGYLTACPTNLGTGLRASVMMFLPALTESGKIDDLALEAKRLGLTIRGVYGEGSRAEGYVYQISNEVTLGVTESEILAQVEEAVERICVAERAEMKKLFARNKLKVMDRSRRSFGILTNALMLTYDEFLRHLAQVKIGIMLDVINIKDIEKLDDLMVSVRPANLCDGYGKTLSEIDRDLVRAEIVGKQLLKLKE